MKDVGLILSEHRSQDTIFVIIPYGHKLSLVDLFQIGKAKRLAKASWNLVI